MIKRGRVALAAVVALAGVACGHPEKSVVDQYFNAVNAKDTQTLSSFAAVTFDKKVDRWAISRSCGGRTASFTGAIAAMEPSTISSPPFAPTNARKHCASGAASRKAA